MFERNIDNYTIWEQLQLYKSTITICGVGGGGCCVSEILCRTGVGHIILVDGDTFESSNKNRQIGATENTIGKYKTDVMARRLRSINPKIHVTSYSEYISDKNYRTLLNGSDIICDTVDGLDNKRMIHRFSQDMRIPIVSGGLSGSAFCFYVIDDFKIPLDTVRPEGSPKSLSANPASVFIQAGFQAQMIIDYLLKRPEAAPNIIHSFNSKTLVFNTRDLKNKII